MVTILDNDLVNVLHAERRLEAAHERVRRQLVTAPRDRAPTSRAPSVGPRRPSTWMVLAWVGLLVAASAAAYGLQLTAAAMLPDSEAADHFDGVPAPRKVLIVAVDSETGDRKQAECEAPPHSYASDVLLVDANDFSAVAQVCSHPNLSGVRP